ncbi:MAG TPA: GNAT family N-acetyltransferase [Herpetosiphonaceae bacterium]|nr:GNAT family N-acetyltransferase [Herpetosiphonaceae bacterium]
MTQPLINRGQNLLIQAWLDRMAAAEAGLGDRAGFRSLRRGPTVAILARRWPDSPGGVPFNRVFDYRPPAETDDPLLAAAGDAVVELMPGDHADHAAERLRAAGYAPAWSIPWLYLPLDAAPAAGSGAIERLDPGNLAEFAATWLAAFESADDELGTRQAFVRFGFAAAGFACFLARVDGRPAAVGVMRMDGDSALVDGAATMPEYRGRGLQKALLAARLAYAREQGARVAFSRTGAGSISQANMLKLGLRPLVESVAWRRPA